MTSQQHAPLGIKLLAAFFAFGAGICLIKIVALLFPGGALDPIWRLNPAAHAAFQEIGRLSILLMVVVGSASALAAVGLATLARRGGTLALRIHVPNLLYQLLDPPV